MIQKMLINGYTNIITRIKFTQINGSNYKIT